MYSCSMSKNNGLVRCVVLCLPVQYEYATDVKNLLVKNSRLLFCEI